jgi:signal transduction histidine kinase
MKSILDDSVALTSKISMELRPNILDMLGLVPAIDWLGKDFSEKSGIDCKIEKKADLIEINPKYSTEVFRILQEALTNIVRHANATKVKIILEEAIGGYTVKVTDNGCGIKEEEKKSPYSLGLLGMKERAMIFKGTVEISGEAKKGTELIIKIPNKTL